MRFRSLFTAGFEWLVIAFRMRRYGGGRPQSLPPRLIFVCTGNICRSPYAEVFARALGFEAISAGIETTPGLPANPQAIIEARARGLDLSTHRTTRWNDVQLKAGDVVVAIGLKHAAVASERVLRAGCSLPLLSAFSRERFSTVIDPYGHEPEVFRQVFDLMDDLLGEMWRYWKKSTPPVPWHRSVWNRARRFCTRTVKEVAGRVLVLAGMHRRLFRDRAVIVAFHSVVGGSSNGALRCGAQDFDRYCRFFARHMRTCSLSELVQRVRDRQQLCGDLVITFDDGYADHAEIAAPILAKHGLAATFFVATHFIDSTTQAFWDVNAGIRSRWMTPGQVKRLHDAGHEIGAQTRTHCDLAAVPEDVAIGEIAGSRDDIRAWTGAAPRHFAIPFGREFAQLPRIAELARHLGFETVALCRGGVVDSSLDAKLWERAPIAPGEYLSPYGWLFDLLRDAKKHSPAAA